MKQYREIKITKKIPTSITCNKCGRTDQLTEYGLEDELYHSFNISFSYGSMYDEEKWKFDLCETCLVEFVKTFKHAPGISEV